MAVLIMIIQKCFFLYQKSQYEASSLITTLLPFSMMSGGLKSGGGRTTETDGPETFAVSLLLLLITIIITITITITSIITIIITILRPTWLVFVQYRFLVGLIRTSLLFGTFLVCCLRGEVVIGQIKRIKINRLDHSWKINIILLFLRWDSS